MEIFEKMGVVRGMGVVKYEGWNLMEGWELLIRRERGFFFFLRETLIGRGENMK